MRCTKSHFVCLFVFNSDARANVPFGMYQIIGKVSFINFPGQLVTDLLTAMTRGEQSEDDISNTNSINYNKMRVCTLSLRKMLDE